ncbi:MAG: MlaC/ttg2D family ABC transporter substrate-binding protein, partial [Stellaceae bacterium]
MMMRRSLFAAMLALLAVAAAPVTPAGAAADPAALIRELGNQALQVLGKNVGQADRAARFRQLFRDDFDVPAIARFVLGRYWRVATEPEQQEFVRLFEGYIALAYANRLAEYSGETLKVVGSRPDGDASLVASEVVRPNGAPPAKV